MTFRFKLYRITTILALLISAFFVLSAVLSLAIAGPNISILLPFVMILACFIHSILSIYLQRSLSSPNLPLKENTPSGIRIMGILGLIFAFMLLMSGFVAVTIPAEQMKDLLKQLPPEQQASIQSDMFKLLGKICLFAGVVFIVNINLSFRFLRQWQELQEGKEEDRE